MVKKPLPVWIPFVVTVLVLLLVVGFIAFEAVGGQMAANATATAQAFGTQTAVAVVSATSTALAGPINCGQISVSPGVSPGAAALDSAGCFQFAFESCRPAEITLQDVNTGTTRTFATGKQGTRCYIVLTTQFSDPSKGQPPAPVQCSGEALQMDGLHISGCSGRDEIVIPAPQP